MPSVIGDRGFLCYSVNLEALGKLLRLVGKIQRKVGQIRKMLVNFY
jgi:hypothetical protein